MKKGWLLILVVAAAAGAAGYYHWQSQGRAARLDIQTAEIKRSDVRRVVSTSGTVRALVTVDIGSQLSGNIGEVNVDYSTEVKKDEVLARIEPSSFETRVREEEAGVAVARANVDLQLASVQRAEANLRKAGLDLGRAKELVLKGATSQAALDTAVAAEESARADLAIAKANVENAKATLLQRDATLDSARIDLDRTYIRSPIDGVVIDKIVEVGQTVAASLQAPKLFTIAQDLNHVQIEAQVDEADIGQVTRDNPVSFTVDAHPDATFDGIVEQIRLTPVALQNVVTYTVVIAADNPLGRLLPGMTANVDIVTGEHANVVVVPNDALRYQPRGPAEALVSDTSATGATQAARSADERTGRLLDRLKVDLALTPEEIDKVRSGVEAEFAALRSIGPQGVGGSQEDAREQARLRVAKVLRAVLTPERYKKYEELQRSRPTSPRSGTIWIYDGGRLVPHHVRLGLVGRQCHGSHRRARAWRSRRAACPRARAMTQAPAPSPPPQIVARDLVKTYRMGDSVIGALQGIDVEVARGEYLAVTGHSGSGKSTFMNLVGALDTPTSGSLQIEGRELSGLSSDALAHYRNETIGFVFQTFNLLARTTALDNVALPLLYSHRANKGDAREKAKACLARVGLAERERHQPSELSGGQQQRVAIARALVNDPHILLADEPTGALDSRTTDEIIALFEELNAGGITVILVTHETDIAARAHRRITFRDGVIVEDEA